jgi:hypothetical protein
MRSNRSIAILGKTATTTTTVIGALDAPIHSVKPQRGERRDGLRACHGCADACRFERLGGSGAAHDVRES